MGESTRRLRSSAAFPVHPFLVAVYPIVALLASNAAQVGAGAATRPAVLALVAAGALFIILGAMTRDRHRSAALASLALVAFFSYGHAYQSLRAFEDVADWVGRHRVVIPVFGAVMAVAVVGVLRVRETGRMTRALNLAAAILVAMPLIQLLLHQVRTRIQPERINGDATALEAAAADLPLAMPDIYYIVLDAYTREDVLRSRFGVDNSEFVAGLERLGFDVFECARSNYAQTELTLASTLNIAYVDDLGRFDPGGRDRTPLLFLIRENAVRRFLEDVGYQVEAFETGYAWSEWSDADEYFRPEGAGGLNVPLSAFEALLLDSTAMRIVTDARSVLPPALGGALEGPVAQHRARVLYTLDELAQMPDRPGPKFVFAHIVAPHRPYVLKPDEGSAAAQAALPPEIQPPEIDGYLTGYRNQVLYLNDRMLPILERIITESDVPPVIILMGDHGADEALPDQRMAILHAVYLPEGDSAEASETRSPVNAFRLVLRRMFGIDLPDLPDASYHSTYDAPFRFDPVNLECPVE